MTVNWKEVAVTVAAVALIGLGIWLMGRQLPAESDEVQVITKHDLTALTSVYVVRIGNNDYVVVNGKGKVAVCSR